MKKVIVPVFPGTNCELETATWFADNLEVEPLFLNSFFHNASSLDADSIAAVLVPGGFSFGDYLRAGALAARSSQMKLIKQWAQAGVPVMGICNGFQILCEAGLLPGVLVRNTSRHHHHFTVQLKLEQTAVDNKSGTQIPWLPPHNLMSEALQAQTLNLPMSCGMGCYVPPPNQLGKVRVAMRYVNNENGSTESIAGICNEMGNVFGMMPHPERASDPILGSTQGLLFLWGLAVSQKLKVVKDSYLESFINQNSNQFNQARH